LLCESEGTEREGKKKRNQKLKYMKKTEVIKQSEIGLEVIKYDFMVGEYTITGFPKRAMTIKEFDSAYDFEEYVIAKVNCKGITFDSESCQFFAYAKTKARAVSFLNAIDKQFAKIREVVNG
jgi:hypothetical protein